MAVRDLEAFVRQRAALFDPNLDVTPGSPFDVQVIQPLTRRLGQDPFSVDLSTFIHDRVAQAFPELANKEGDAVTDLLNKPITLLWDPIVREIFRIRRGLSFQDPSSLTVEEAEALGANLFADRRVGDFSRGVGRIFFSQAQNLSISPANFATSKTGLHYFPTEIQSIRLEEMLLNVSPDSLFFFDINLIAEAAGDQYNIEPNSLASIANIASAVRVSNPRRFGFGVSDETAVEFVDRAKQELTERSLVTLRGIAAKLLKGFPEVRRLNVVGFNDPEMQRDIIKGGGSGQVIAFSGANGTAVPDGEGKALTRRFNAPIGSIIARAPSGLVLSDFIALIGPPGIAPPSFVLCPIYVIAGGDIRDLRVRAVIDANTIDLEEQVLGIGGTGFWTLRKVSLTLSDIPGGIIFPDGPQGTITVPDDQIHIGGATDVHVKGQDLDASTLAIDNVTDDRPALSGLQLQIPGAVFTPPYVDLLDLVTDVNYSTGDSTFHLLEDARLHEFSLQIVNGPSAGSYRIVDVLQTSGFPVRLFLDPPTPTLGGAPVRWRIFDLINVDLTEPKETRISDDDLKTLQNSDIVTTAGGIDFQELGVAKDDVLRIFSGSDAGDYTLIADPLMPSFDKLQLDRLLTSTHSSLRYTIFRANPDGGVIRPVIRVESIDLLDTSKQPLGSKIPYAKPIDIQSRAFQNPGRGVKVEVRDAVLGIVSLPDPGPFPVGTLSLNFTFPLNPTLTPFTVVFSGPLSAAGVVAEINTASTVGTLAEIVDSTRVGIRPAFLGGSELALVVINTGTALPVLFGASGVRTTADIHSEEIESTIGWTGVSPAINQDNLDVAMVVDGNQIGFYGDLRITLPPASLSIIPPLSGLLSAKLSSASVVERSANFFPETGRHLIVGSRSIGSVRCFFLDPTSIEFDEQSFFSVTLADGGTVRFFPDPTVDYQRIPALPGGPHPMDGSSPTGGTTFTSASQDFFKSGIKVADHLIVKFHPIAGTVVLAVDPVVGLANQTFTFSIDEGPDRTLTFIRDDVSIPVTDVTRQGVINQINAAVGKDVASLTGTNTVKFNTDVLFIVRGTGSANPTILGDIAGTFPLQSFTSDQDNRSPHAGTYIITGLIPGTPMVLPLDRVFPPASPFSSPVTEQSYEVRRPSLQRVTTTQMAENKAEASLFFFDVELVSEGTGDLWNIASDLQLRAEGFRSDGYFLTTSNPNLTFSTAEFVELAISRSILEQGVDDDPSNATQVSAQNIQVNYQRSTLVGDVQNFVSSETERVVNESSLSRHLIPHFVRFDFSYTGGSREEVVKPDIETYISNLFPVDAVEVGAIENIVSNRGATSIKNPVDLIAVVYDKDRSVQAQRSQDRLTTTRLAAFIPDVLNITRTS